MNDENLCYSNTRTGSPQWYKTGNAMENKLLGKKKIQNWIIIMKTYYPFHIGFPPPSGILNTKSNEKIN